MRAPWLGLSLLVLSVAPATAQEPPFSAARADWYVRNYARVITTIERGDAFEVLPVVGTVCELWASRDGAVGAEVAPAVARALIHQPALTLSWFRDRRAAFEAWVVRMPDDLLTDYTGDRAEALEALRQELIDAITRFGTETEEAVLAEMAAAVADRAGESEIRRID